MPRYRLTLEYDGGGFVGWQRQENGLSVQAAVEQAVKSFCGETVTVHAAGRTDAGVHALGQVAHFDLKKSVDGSTLCDALNAFLRPAPIAVIEAAGVSAEFHARFSATGRRYRYRIVNRRAPLTLDRGHAWLVFRPLDAEAMNKAAQGLAGTHDFTTFRAAVCQASSPVKTLDRLEVYRNGNEIIIDAAAQSFLHRQVRSIAGSLKLVGEGKWAVDEPARALAACDRTRCGPVAPPEGLYLMAVDYGDAFK